MRWPQFFAVMDILSELVGSTACLRYISKLLTKFRIIPMVYGIILMVLAFSESAQYWRESAGLNGFPLVKVLIQDQVIYFIL